MLIIYISQYLANIYIYIWCISRFKLLYTAKSQTCGDKVPLNSTEGSPVGGDGDQWIREGGEKSSQSTESLSYSDVDSVGAAFLECLYAAVVSESCLFVLFKSKLYANISFTGQTRWSHLLVTGKLQHVWGEVMYIFVFVWKLHWNGDLFTSVCRKWESFLSRS